MALHIEGVTHQRRYTAKELRSKYVTQHRRYVAKALRGKGVTQQKALRCKGRYAIKALRSEGVTPQKLCLAKTLRSKKRWAANALRSECATQQRRYMARALRSKRRYAPKPLRSEGVTRQNRHGVSQQKASRGKSVTRQRHTHQGRCKDNAYAATYDATQQAQNLSAGLWCDGGASSMVLHYGRGLGGGNGQTTAVLLVRERRCYSLTEPWGPRQGRGRGWGGGREGFPHGLRCYLNSNSDAYNCCRLRSSHPLNEARRKQKVQKHPPA